MSDNINKTINFRFAQTSFSKEEVLLLTAYTSKYVDEKYGKEYDDNKNK